MVETMYAAPGIGLAAPQIGVSLRIFVIDLSVGRDAAGLIILINPVFVERDGMQLEEEGCLSLPGFTATVARPAARGRQGIESSTAPSSSGKDRGCWRAPFSTRWITSTGGCSSIGCADQARSDRAEDSQARARGPVVSVNAPSAHRLFWHAGVCCADADALLGRGTRSLVWSRNRTGRAGAVSVCPMRRSKRWRSSEGCLFCSPIAWRARVRRIFAALDAELGVVAAYGKICPNGCSQAPRLGMINVHASLLPKHRGAAPVHRAISAATPKPGSPSCG